MKKKKMTFSGISDLLTRSEMKQIMAGSGSACGSCSDNSGSYACTTTTRGGSTYCNCPSSTATGGCR